MSTGLSSTSKEKYYRITRAGEELLDEVKKNLEELYDEIVKENGK